MIAIVDYGMGNLGSVFNALQALGSEPYIAAEPSQLARASAILLPGVGSFGDGMENLTRSGFIPEMERRILREGLPFLGICLGFQLLADTGEEGGERAGLGWVPGRVRHFDSASFPELRFPHVGWNTVEKPQASKVLDSTEGGESFYFVHSYIFQPARPGDIAGVSEYGEEFAVAIEVGNIAGVQFHPEKSHRAGLKLLDNWVRQVRLTTC